MRAITRDSSGYLWISTWDGLSRFDGYEFKNYYHVPNDSTSLPFLSTRRLIVDCRNNLWIQNDLGLLVKYNRSSDDFTVIRSISGIPIESDQAIETDSDGSLEILSGDKILRLNNNLEVNRIMYLVGKSGSRFETSNKLILTFLINKDEVWVLDNGETVLKFSSAGENKFKLDHEYRLRSWTNRVIDFDYFTWYRFYFSPKGNLWIFSNTGLFKLDESKKEFIKYESGIPTGEFEGNQIFFWGSPDKGIYLYNTSFKTVRHIPSRPVSLPIAIYPYDENSVWFSGTTSTGVAIGLTKLTFISDFFKNYLITDRDSAAPAVYSVAVDKYNNIWAGIRGYDHMLQYGPDGVPRSINRLKGNLRNNARHVRAIIPVHNGIWIGYFDKLLQFYDYETGKFTNYLLPAGSSRAITPGDEGKLYVGSNKVYRFDPVSGRTDTLWKLERPEGLLKLYKGTDGTIWGAMGRGKLLKFDPRTNQGKVTIIPPGTSNLEDIICGENGELWLAFLGEGVCRYNPQTGVTRFYTTKQGLSNNTTYNLLKDSAGTIWVSTNNGISRINPESDQIRDFGLSDGLKIKEFNSGAKFIASDGRFFFGGMGGFVSFYPDSLQKLERGDMGQRIMLTDFKVSGETKRFTKPLEEIDTIVLNKGENNFHLALSTTDFINSDKTSYRYMLSGINDKWNEINSQNRNINYTNLPAGWHILYLQATDRNDSWGISKKLTIRIIPYIYQTTIFRIASPLIIIIIITTIIAIYIRQLKQRASLQQNRLQLKALKGQMNPHFIFNSLNSINYFISRNDKLSANRYISDFSRLIRSILYNMENDYIPLEAEIESLRDYLKIEYLRFGDKFDYEITVDQGVEPEKHKVSSGLIQPFIENSIWHGLRGLENRKGLISVKLTKVNGKIVCIISDDGIGRKKSSVMKDMSIEKGSRGIGIVRERLKIINKLQKNDFQFNINDLYPDREETGTQVIIDLPLEKVDEGIL